MTSLFGRMSRYPPRLRFNATENQHTEALAAVLDADRGLARALAAHWLELPSPGMPGDIRVRTQAPAPGLDRVDLELRFGPSGRPDRIVWVEIKVDAHYTTFPLPSGIALKQTWLEFDLFAWDHLGGAIAFGAGVPVERGMPLPHPDRFDRLAQSGFEVTQRWHPVAYRFSDVGGVLAAPGSIAFPFTRTRAPGTVGGP